MNLTEPLKYEFASLADGKSGYLSGANLDKTKKKAWSEQEVDEIRAAALAEGDAKARARTAESETARRVAALEAIANGLAALDRNMSSTFASIERGAVDLAVSVGSAIAEQALAEAPHSVLAPLLNESFTRLADQARVTIAVHDSMVESIQAGISDLAAETGFAGHVRVTGGAGHVADCRIDWGDGGLERCLETIKSAFAKRLAQRPIVSTEPTAVEES